MRPPYLCIRCGYETPHFTAMKNHLYKKLKPCPPAEEDIELTDDAKKCIMEKRAYRVNAAQTPQPSSQIVINANVFTGSVTNIITQLASMDVIDKHAKYINHMDLQHKGFEDLVGEMFSPLDDKLREDKIKYEMNHNSFLEMVDKVSVCKKLEDFNIMYDTETNKIKVFTGGEWEEYLLAAGTTYIITVLRDYILTTYEKYLIKRMESESSYHAKQCYKERLHDYYKFVCCFDVKPEALSMSNAEIMHTNFGKDCFDIAEKYTKEYKNVENKLTKSEINRVVKDVVDIIKNNTKRTIKDLNKKVMELIKVDEGFQQIVAL